MSYQPVTVLQEAENDPALNLPTPQPLMVNLGNSHDTSTSDLTCSPPHVTPCASMEEFSTTPTVRKVISSLNKPSFSRRYSSNDLSIDKAESFALDLFDFWDVEGRGYLYPSDIVLKNLDIKFVQAIVRVLAPLSDTILKENVIECVAVLKNGDLSSKVRLLVQFMDADGNQTISFEELKEYLQVSDDTMLTKLGLKKREGHTDDDTTSLTYEDILSIFQESDRGMEAISIFCDQILRILSTSVPPRGFLGATSSSVSLTRLNSMMVGVNNTNPCFEAWNSFKAWCTKTKHRIQTVSHASEVFKTWLIALQIALWLTYFFYHHFKGYPLAFCFAKGFGLNLRVLSILMYLTMARTTMGQLYSIRLLRPFIPLGVNIEVHSFLGFCIGMHMFGHTFGHIAYQTMYTTGFQNAFTQTALINGATWESKLKGDGITGFILIFLVLLMGATALLRSLSAKYYQLFTISHYAYLLYLPMIFLHVPRLWPYFVAIGAIMIIERLYDLKQNTLYTTLGHSRPCNNGITYLSVPRYGMMTYPGSYYRIKIPALSFYEWHPFSLAGSTSSHHLSFFIASTGDWTRALHQLVKDPERRGQTLVQVQGPFLAPASQALIRKPGAKILCVASGIGITPFFSVMATKVTDEVNFENDRMLYKQLFQEKSRRSQQMALHKHNRSQNSLLQVLRSTQSESLSPDSRQKRPSTTYTKNGSLIVGEDAVIKDLEAGCVNGSGKALSNGSVYDSDTDSDEDGKEDSILRVVWSNRDVKELLFYLDYVHHLVKSQDQLHDDDDEEAGDDDSSRNRRIPFKRQASNRNRRKRIVVEVEVYLTGLGNKSDPVYMLSQTLFLLSIANQSSSYMKIHFGRPDLEKIVKTFSPEEVYYCGGSALKDKLHDVCCQERIPFHPEDFDAGGGAAIKAYKSAVTGFNDMCCKHE